VVPEIMVDAKSISLVLFDILMDTVPNIALVTI